MADWQSRATVTADVVYFEYRDAESMRRYEEVFVWDLDKTYLDTKWGSLKELMQTAFEKAFQKRNVPGTGSLVRALSSSWQEMTGQRAFPIYFITASPPQLEERIMEKLRLDGIQPFGCFYKDNLKNLRPSRMWRLTQQIGFKLQALLQLRLRLHENVRQIMWGDDSEADATIYSIYSDICAHRLSQKELEYILRSLRVVGEQTEMILGLQERVPETDPVEKIYINLASDTDPEYYLKFGRRVVPTENTFQAALDLFQDRRINFEQLSRVAQDMILNYGFTIEELELSMDSMIRRQNLGAPCVDELLPLLKENKLITPHFSPSVAPLPVKDQIGHRVFELEGVHEPWVAEHIDYLHDYR